MLFHHRQSPQLKSTFRPQRKMCNTHTFHHLCGHRHSTLTFPCQPQFPVNDSEPISHNPPSSSSSLSTKSYTTCTLPSPYTCAAPGRQEETHLYPTLCLPCASSGLIGVWLAQSPVERRFEVLRAWKRERRNVSARREREEEAEAEALVESGGSGNGSCSGSANGSDLDTVKEENDEEFPPPIVKAGQQQQQPLPAAAEQPAKEARRHADLEALKERCKKLRERLQRLLRPGRESE